MIPVSGLTWSIFHIKYSHVFYCALLCFGYIMSSEWSHVIIFFRVPSLALGYGEVALVSEKSSYRVLVKLTSTELRQNIKQSAKHIYICILWIYIYFVRCTLLVINTHIWCLVFKLKCIKRKHCLYYWPFFRGINQSPVNSPHKGQWCRTLKFSLICVWTNSWESNRDAGDLRHPRAHYDVTVMDPCFAKHHYYVLCCVQYHVILYDVIRSLHPTETPFYSLLALNISWSNFI